MAYREDARRWSNGRIFRDIVGKCARALVSRDWCGCWEGNHRLGGSLAVRGYHAIAHEVPSPSRPAGIRVPLRVRRCTTPT
jgi:hypothetical protein